MQRCASCGAENRDIARFCAVCGHRLPENAPSSAPQDAPLPPAAPAPPDEPVLHAGFDGVLSEAEHPDAGAGPLEAVGEADALPHAAPSDAPSEMSRGPGMLSTESMPGAGAGDGGQEATPEDAPPPLEPGVLVGGRWQVDALREVVGGRNTYLALDLAACPRCGESFDPGEDYCSECGVELAQAGPPPAVTLHEALAPDALDPFGPSLMSWEDRLYAAVAAAAPLQSAQPAGPQSLALAVGYASDRGLVRDLDEDSLFVFTLAGMFESRVGPSLGLFIVADGMGGHEGGELASREAVKRIANTLMDGLLGQIFEGPLKDGADGVKKSIERAIVDANTTVYEMARGKGIDAGTTVTLAAVVDGEAHVANVGDSRTFLFREGRLRQVTQDHSLVASLVAAGAIQPDEIYTHPQRNAVYRSLGTGPHVEVDQFYELLQPGDSLVLCCDGIWEAIRPEGIEEVLLAIPDPQSACDEMVRRSNAAGGEDNLSVIVVRVAQPKP